jgi:ribosomal protein L7Ae-like RNA K-turn-binding protein
MPINEERNQKHSALMLKHAINALMKAELFAKGDNVLVLQIQETRASIVVVAQDLNKRLSIKMGLLRRE